MIKIRDLNVRASVLAASLVFGGAAVTVGLSTPVFAQDTAPITQAQVAQIQAQMAQALAAVPQGLTGTALQTAQANAIAQTAESMIAAIGQASTGPITDALMSSPALAQANVSGVVVGQGLGQASSFFATPANGASGAQTGAAIGTAVATEGPPGSQGSFSVASSAGGAPPSVAAASVASPTITATGSIPGAPGGGAGPAGLPSGAAGTAAPPPCSGPSCS